MRLAVFTNQFPARVSTFFARDMQALAECGALIDVFPLYPLDAELWPFVPSGLDERILPRERIHHLTVRDTLAPKPLRPGQAVRWLGDTGRLGLEALRYGPGCLAKTVYAAAQAAVWAGQDGYDHVLAYWANYSASSAYIYHRLTRSRTPFSMIVHARVDLYWRPASLARKLLYADNVFVVCEYNKTYLADRYAALYPRIADRVSVHHLGLDLNDYAYHAGPRVPGRIVAVGRLEPLKGYQVLLQAIANLRRDGVAVELELVGGGDQEPELRALARRLGIAPAVRFRGWQQQPEVRRAMREASVFVQPSIRPDAMPTVVKEALALGTPVIASDLAGIPEMLDSGRCGVLVPPGDAARLGAAIRDLLRDPERRRELSTAGRRHAERLFDIRRTGQVLADRLRGTPSRRACD